MKKIIYFTLSFTFLISCDVKETKEYKTLLNKNNELKVIIDSLENTSENRFLKANNLFKSKNYEEAIIAFEIFIKNYRDSYYYPKAKKNLSISKTRFKNIEIEKERRERLKFKIFKESNPVKIDSILIKAYGFNFTNEFTFDRYDDTYHYRKAERGNKFLSFDVTITSEKKDPNLPLFYIYVFEKNKLKRLSRLKGMSYEFYKWEDYGTYLGNYSDYSNDFSRTKRIRFDVGEQLQVSKYSGKEIYLVVSKKEKASRQSTRIGNPEIEYSPYSIDVDIPEILDIETFEKNFILVRRLNKP